MRFFLEEKMQIANKCMKNIKHGLSLDQCKLKDTENSCCGRKKLNNK